MEVGRSSSSRRILVRLKLIRYFPVLMEYIRRFGKTIIPMLKVIKYGVRRSVVDGTEKRSASETVSARLFQ